MFGEAGLTGQLAREPGGSAAACAASVLAAVRRHAGEHPQSDDITVAAVRCGGG